MNLQQFNIFPTFRPNQEFLIREVIQRVLHSKKKFITLNLPTGSGKSIIAYIACKYLSTYEITKCNQDGTDPFSCYILSSKNMLLDQYNKDFGKYIKIIKGGDHYNCLLNGSTYSEGVCKLCPHKRLPCSLECPYKIAREEAKVAPITLSNFHYMIIDMDFAHQFKTRDVCFIDECHQLESIFADFRSVVFTEEITQCINFFLDLLQESDNPIIQFMRSNYQTVLNGDMSRIKNKMFVGIKNLDDADNMLITAKKRMNPILASIESTVEGVDPEDEYLKDDDMKSVAKIKDKLSSTYCKINNYFKSKHLTKWVIEENFDERKKEITGIEIKPIDISFLANDLFDKLARKIVFMSATAGNKTQLCKHLGIKESDMDYISVDSAFPAENRPFYNLGILHCSSDTIEEGIKFIAESIDKIIEQFPNKKGIVHSVSYENSEKLKQLSKFKDRMLTHTDKSKEVVIKEFIESEDKILVSPSILEGMDFKGDLSEFTIFLKVPYLYLGDHRVAEKLKDDEEWYVNQAVISILQGTGRSVRSEHDVAATFMLDSNFNRLLKDYNYLFPKDFLRTVINL